MRLLLDTHALLWWHADDPSLGEAANEAIRLPSARVWFSIASLWEIAIKVRIAKLEADLDDIIAASEADGFASLDISHDHLRALAALPAHHRDPFDHLLIAQALSEGLTFVTADRRAPLYGVATLACA